MLKQQKEEVVEALRKEFERAQGALFLDFSGLTAAETQAFRSKVRQTEGEITYRVVKNNLAVRALAGTPAADAAKVFEGTPTGVLFGFTDPVTPAKMVFEFLKETEHLKVKGGIVEQKVLNSKEAQALSKMPGRVEMLGEILGLILSPAANLLALVKGPSGRLLSQIEKKAEDAEAKDAG